MCDQLESMQKMHRACQHEFLNYLQVISGMVQLSKTEELLPYIRKASEEVQRVGRLAACGDARLALLIYENFFLEVVPELLLDVDGRLPFLSADSLAAAAELFADCKAYLLQGGCVRVELVLRGGDAPNLSLRFFSLTEVTQDLYRWRAMTARRYICFESEGQVCLTLPMDKLPTVSER